MHLKVKLKQCVVSPVLKSVYEGVCTGEYTGKNALPPTFNKPSYSSYFHRSQLVWSLSLGIAILKVVTCSMDSVHNQERKKYHIHAET